MFNGNLQTLGDGVSSAGLNEKYEAENQAIMERYGLVEVEVVRNSEGKIVQMAP